MTLQTLLRKMILICVFASGAMAQQEADSLTLGLPAEVPNVGDPYIAQKYNDWTIHCIKMAGGNDPCEMKQLLLNEENQPMSEISLFKLSEGQPAIAAANVVVPLETLLTAPLSISYDQDTRKQYPYSFCSAVGCFVRIGITQQEIDKLKKGDFAEIAVVHISRPQTPIKFDMSLNGFTKAFNALPETNQ